MTIIVNQNRFFKMMLSNLSTYTKHTTIDYSALKKLKLTIKQLHYLIIERYVTLCALRKSMPYT